ncbi:hypothetical protein [Paenibacillus allorhizoplanae]|uniref:hypothetical protein n=1 Tax=Paenibacillus allorhizoplanae TaxID=2905648 RepID=UPI001F2BBCF4|nr:hypothetical protein [Paenibacillus allorhizoplanae]
MQGRGRFFAGTLPPMRLRNCGIGYSAAARHPISLALRTSTERITGKPPSILPLFPEVSKQGGLPGGNPVISRNELLSGNLAGENPSNRFGADLTQM